MLLGLIVYMDIWSNSCQIHKIHCITSWMMGVVNMQFVSFRIEVGYDFYRVQDD
jgi:hypothetical protein